MGIIGLDYNAVMHMAGVYAIEMSPETMDKVAMLERLQLERIEKEAKK